MTTPFFYFHRYMMCNEEEEKIYCILQFYSRTNYKKLTMLLIAVVHMSKMSKQGGLEWQEVGWRPLSKLLFSYPSFLFHHHGAQSTFFWKLTRKTFFWKLLTRKPILMQRSHQLMIQRKQEDLTICKCIVSIWQEAANPYICRHKFVEETHGSMEPHVQRETVYITFDTYISYISYIYIYT